MKPDATQARLVRHAIAQITVGMIALEDAYTNSRHHGEITTALDSIKYGCETLHPIAYQYRADELTQCLLALRVKARGFHGQIGAWSVRPVKQTSKLNSLLLSLMAHHREILPLAVGLVAKH